MTHTLPLPNENRIPPVTDLVPGTHAIGAVFGGVLAVDPDIAAVSAMAPRRPVIDAAVLREQLAFSLRTYGPGRRTEGVVDHIRKELVEVLEDPEDRSEPVDVIILGFDLALRQDPTRDVQDVIDEFLAKLAKNYARTWPDWRTMDPNKAIEHDRTADVAA